MIRPRCCSRAVVLPTTIHVYMTAGWARRPLIYGAVGAGTTVVGLSAYSLGVAELRLPYLLALLLGHGCSIAIAYPLQRRIVFRVRGRVVLEFLKYELVTGGSLLLNAALLALLVSGFKTPRLPAELVVTAVLAVGSYVGHRDFSFVRRTAALLKE